MRTLLPLLLALVGPTALAADAASPFTLMSIEDQSTTLAQFGDGPVVLSFWATWCGPCKEEMPHLQKLWETHKDKGVTVVSISTDDARSSTRVKPYIKAQGYTFPVLLDKESKVIAQYNPSKTLPFTAVVHKGQIVKTHAGYNPGDEKELIAFVDGLLAPAPDKPVTP